MPHFTLPIQEGIGPVLMVYVGVSNPRFLALRAAGMMPPPAVQLVFLIDTGASHSSVDLAAIAPLGLTPTGSVLVSTPSTGSTPVEQYTYDVSVFIHHAENSKFLALLPMTGTDFSSQPIHGLLGRDFLRSCLFVYDGQAGTHAIAF